MKNKMAALIMGLSMSVYTYAGTEDMYIEECNGGMAEMCHMAAQFFEHKKQPADAKKYYLKAMNIMKKECSASDVNACDNMGDFYAKGLGVEKNKSEAKKAYQKAFELSKKSCAEGDENYCSMVDFINKKLKKL